MLNIFDSWKHLQSSCSSYSFYELNVQLFKGRGFGHAGSRYELRGKTQILVDMLVPSSQQIHSAAPE
jgi:hypothetical protein